MIGYVLVFIFSNKHHTSINIFGIQGRMANTSAMKYHVTLCIHLIVLSSQDVNAINSHSARLVMQALV